MGFSVIVSKHVKDSKNDCSCEPTHDQVQPEKSHGVSGSHCEAQRQDLLCSRGYLPPSLNYNVPSTQPAQLWGRLLGGDSRRRHSFRLDRGPSTEASVNQVGAQDGPSTWIFKVDQLGDFRVGQERRREVRRRVRPHHQPRNFKSCPRIGQLSSTRSTDLGKSHNLKIRKPTSHGRVGP